MPNLPWLEYAGQSTAALIAAKETHRIDSILCAFEQAVQRKLELEQALSEEEMLILAVEALEREVNNGGYHQFFVNSPLFAGSIADFLQPIGCERVAAITKKALERLAPAGLSADAVLNAALPEDAVRDEFLTECDQEYYSTREIEPALFHFLEDNASRIHLP